MELPDPYAASILPAYAGRDRHLAISIKNLQVLQRRLESVGIPFNLSSSGRAALFCRDLDGNGFEFVEDVSL
jgi:glyoxylase I family protein